MRLAAPTPSYAFGYARSAGASAYPELWHGLIGAWAPALGNTGVSLKDLSGHGLDGTLTNMDVPRVWGGSPFGQVITYDGTDDHVVLPGGAGSIWDLATDAVSVMAFVAPTFASTSGSRILSKSQNNNSDDYGIHALKNGANDHYRARVRTPTGLLTLLAPTFKYPFDGTWHQITQRYDGANAFLYVDTLQEATAAKTGILTNGGATELYLGVAKGLTARFWQGHIGPVYLWNYAIPLAFLHLLFDVPYAPFLRASRRVVTVLSAVSSATASAAGTATASATGQPRATATAAASGLGTGAGTGQSTATSAGSSSGIASATGTGASRVQATATAAGTSTAAAIAGGFVGSAAGMSTAAAISLTLFNGVAATAGVASVAGTGRSTVGAAALASGAVTVAGIGTSTFLGVAMTSGVAVVLGSAFVSMIVPPSTRTLSVAQDERDDDVDRDGRTQTIGAEHRNVD